MVSEFDRARVVMLRGLGYSQKEISEKTGLSQSAISYILSEIKKRALEEGDEATFVAIMSSGYGPLIVRAMQMLFKDKLR
ncbi:MAG TPA: sigma-70 family RNA polymerase sigma factor [Candidatus Altiarchaeales archaeon]|nr:sigma-70 family RNA polymerase sigma factor [Candidatus Altiarchaeales archaeon]